MDSGVADAKREGVNVCTLCQSLLMLAIDNKGVKLNAQYSIDASDGKLSLVLESASGPTPDRPARNPDYRTTLTLLLGRLRQRRAVLLTAVVDSEFTRVRFGEQDRRLIAGPIRLTEHEDVEALRKDLTRAQRTIGQRTGSGKSGNATKRIRLQLDVPGYGLDDISRLESDLATPGDLERTLASLHDEAVELLDRLRDRRLQTITGRDNLIIKMSDDDVWVRTERSPGGKPVAIRLVAEALRVLYSTGSVVIEPQKVGYRSAFIGAVLRELPNVQVVHSSPPAIILDRGAFGAAGPHDSAGPFGGDLDRSVTGTQRGEQGVLRRGLLNNRTEAPCALCGETFPRAFLHAAHIKKRSECSDDERRDMRQIAMLACVFGCDALYEVGYVSVDVSGRIQRAAGAPVTGPVADRLAILNGRLVDVYESGSKIYFDWHHANVVQRASM